MKNSWLERDALRARKCSTFETAGKIESGKVNGLKQTSECKL